MIDDSSLVPNGSNSITYPSSTLLVNPWEGTSSLSLEDGVVTATTGTGSWWGAALEIEASSGEDPSALPMVPWYLILRAIPSPTLISASSQVSGVITQGPR